MTSRGFLLFSLLCAAGCAIDSSQSAEDQRNEAEATAADTGGGASLRVMTYNIKHGEVAGIDLSKIADVIKLSNPDILGLQEVDEVTHRSQGKHETDELSALTGMPYKYFAANFPYDGGQYGLAILSKYPINGAVTVRLDAHTKSENGYEPRIAAIADVTAKGEMFTFVTIHASLHQEERAGDAKAMLTALGARASRALIVGDFNETPSKDIGDALTGAGFVDTYAERHSDPGLTEPAITPSRRIDFIYRAKTMGNTVHAWVPDTQASDHRPVGAVVPLH